MRKAQIASLTAASLLVAGGYYGLADVHFSPDERIKAFGYPLDNVFTRGIIVHSAQSKSLRSSDHNPVELHFSLE